MSGLTPRKDRGDRLSAAEVNDLFARVAALEQRSGLAAARAPLRINSDAATEALGVNVGNVDLPAFAPAGIAGHYYTDANQLRFDRALSIRLPEAGDEGKWCVTAEPIKAGQAGTVFVHGVFPVRISNDEETSPAAVDIEPGATHAVGASNGAAQVLFEEEALGVHIALVRFTGPAAAVTERVDASDFGGEILKQGTQTLDGVVCAPGARVLLSDGVWRVGESAWSRTGAPDFVIVMGGDERGETAFYKATEAPTYKGLGGYLK